MKSALKKLSLGLACACVLTGLGCGGGGGGDREPSSEELSQQALDLLGAGDVTGAKEMYDKALEADGENAQAAFGAGFTRLLLIPESAPSNKILGELGQGEFNVSRVVGPTGYLAAMNVINESETTIDGVEGPFHGSIQPFTSSSHFNDEGSVAVDCSHSGVHMAFRDEANSLKIDATFNLLIEEKRDGELAFVFQFPSGEPYDVNAELDENDCLHGRPYSLSVKKDGFYYFISDESAANGSLVLNQAGSARGEEFEIQLVNLTLVSTADDAQTITLNGTLKDGLTDEKPLPEDYFPFAEDFVSGEMNKLRRVLSKTRADLQSDDLIAEAMDFVPLYQEVGEFLAKADRDNDFQFIVPKGLYFGNKDIPLNRVDLKGMRAGIDMVLAGFHLADSWTFGIALGSLFDGEGNKLYTEEEIVEQLNRFFELKSENHLDEAQMEIAEGLQLVLDAHDLIPEVTVDGVFEDAPGTVAGYAEFRDAVSIIQKSLSEKQLFPYVDPVVNISLQAFFNDPPDASKIDFDPFVVEDGGIKPVEAFFEKILEGLIDLDLAKTYRKAFTALQDSDLGKAVFDEFDGFFVAGRYWNVLKRGD